MHESPCDPKSEIVDMLLNALSERDFMDQGHAKRLLPSDTVYIKTKSVNGIVVKEGSINSHSAILARAFGVLAISNIDKSIKLINNKDELILDGEKGIAIVRPSKNDKVKYQENDRRKERKLSISIAE